MTKSRRYIDRYSMYCICMCIVWHGDSTSSRVSGQSKEIKDKQTNRLLAQTSSRIGKGSLRGIIKEEQRKNEKKLEIPKGKWKVLSLHLVSCRFVSFVSSLLPLEGAVAWKSVFCFPFDKFTHDL